MGKEEEVVRTSVPEQLLYDAACLEVVHVGSRVLHACWATAIRSVRRTRHFEHEEAGVRRLVPDWR
jgi:hypothetical protein